MTIRTRPGKERREAPPRQQVELGRGLLAGCSVDAVRDRVREPVHEREPCVHLDREPAIRRREEDAPADAERLRDEPPLPLASADVLDHGVREDDVERAVGERQRARVTLDVRICG